MKISKIFLTIGSIVKILSVLICISFLAVFFNANFSKYQLEEEINNYNDQKNNLPINKTGEVCNKYGDNLDFIECIVDYFVENFDYMNDPEIKPLNDSWNGDCANAVLHYKLLLNQRSIKNRAVVITGHTFLIIDLKEEYDLYCILDQYILKCF